VLALATLEHLNTALGWLNERGRWNYQLLQVQLSRSVPVGPLTRFAPLNGYDSDGNPHSLSSDIEQGELESLRFEQPEHGSSC